MKTRMTRNQKEYQEQILVLNGLDKIYAPSRDLVERLAIEVSAQRSQIAFLSSVLDNYRNKSFWWLLLNRKKITHQGTMKPTTARIEWAQPLIGKSESGGCA